MAFIFSQDLAEVAGEVRDISWSAERWLKMVSAFPYGPNATSTRGINLTDWLGMAKRSTRLALIRGTIARSGDSGGEASR